MTFVVESLDASLREPENRSDPYPFYRELRERAPRLYLEQFDIWAFSTHADVTAVLRDPRMSSNSRHRPGNDEFVEMVRQLGLGDLIEGAFETLLFLDPPDHTRIRKLASKAFTPRAVEAMRPHVADLVARLLDAVADAGSMDVVADLAQPLPVTVISEMLGLPESDLPELTEWTHAMTRLLDPGDDFSVFFPAQAAAHSFDEYLERLMAERRKTPGDDLLSAFLQVQDDGASLTDDEIRGLVVLLFGAGHETTVNLIGNGLQALLRQRDQWDRLCADPSLVKPAVEELLRFDSPVQLTARIATCDVEVDGLELRQGQQVICMLGAANRDPAQFAEPEQLDVGRAENRHVAFGGGIHLCLGAPLARLEAQEALAALAQRMPGIDMTVNAPVRKETVTLRGLQSLPVGW
jgi:pimeloyl-[acyl-carrier protein] synthase